MRANRRLVVSLVATALVFGTCAAAAPVGAKTPKITVTPSKNLKPGQTVHVTGTGFKAKTDFVGIECLKGTDDPTECDGVNYSLITSDAAGGLSAKFAVHRTLYLPAGLADCGRSGCELVVSPLRTFDTSATAVLAFDPRAPLPKTRVQADPATDLLDQQSITVTGSGFDFAGGSEDVIGVFQCVVTPFSCATGVPVQPPGSSGRFRTSLPAHRVITDAMGNRVDCAKTTHTCEILAFDLLDADYHATTPLAFDASVPPPPPPRLNVQPDTKLPYYARVAVTGKHWASDDLVVFLECAGTSASACAFLDAAGFTDSQGKFKTTPMLQRMLPNLLHPKSRVDCAARRSDCVLIAQDSNGDTVTSPLAFDPDAPVPPPPSAVITQAAPYRNNQVVHIKGKHFAPKADFSVAECAVAAHVSACFSVADGSQRTNAAGDLSTLFQVQRKVEFFDVLDCTKTKVKCVLQVSSEGGATVELPLVFKTGADSDAPGPAARLVPVRGRPHGWLAALNARPVRARSALPGLSW